jgi:predicted transcriptional regulator
MSTPDPLEDVAFLARSAHRVAVLETLADGSMTRPELHEVTSIPQPTLGRILDPFQKRNWIERRGREYALTAWGELLVTDFRELIETVETIQQLSDVVQQLPTDEMGFDIREFADATVWIPERGDAFGHLRRLEELFFGADRARLLSPTVAMGAPDDYQELHQEFLDSDKRAESIVSVEALTQVQTDETYAEMFRPAFETGRVRMFVYNGPIPYLLAMTDDTTLLAPIDEHGIPVALVETENQTVRLWVKEKLDDYQERSTEVTLDDGPM